MPWTYNTRGNTKLALIFYAICTEIMGCMEEEFFCTLISWILTLLRVSDCMLAV